MRMPSFETLGLRDCLISYLAFLASHTDRKWYGQVAQWFWTKTILSVGVSIVRVGFTWYGALVIKWIYANMHTYVHTFFSQTCPEEEVWRSGTQPMSLRVMMCVYAKCTIIHLAHSQEEVWLEDPKVWG